MNCPCKGQSQTVFLKKFQAQKFVLADIVQQQQEWTEFNTRKNKYDMRYKADQYNLHMHI